MQRDNRIFLGMRDQTTLEGALRALKVTRARLLSGSLPLLEFRIIQLR
jgi:hypothetical protein